MNDSLTSWFYLVTLAFINPTSRTSYSNVRFEIIIPSFDKRHPKNKVISEIHHLQHGNSALHEAAWNGYSDMISLLLRHKCNVFVSNKVGNPTWRCLSRHPISKQNASKQAQDLQIKIEHSIFSTCCYVLNRHQISLEKQSVRSIRRRWITVEFCEISIVIVIGSRIFPKFDYLSKIRLPSQKIRVDRQSNFCKIGLSIHQITRSLWWEFQGTVALLL